MSRRARERPAGLLKPMRRALRAGGALLTPEARADLLLALRQDWLPGGLARGRDGAPDLYYTLFAQWLSDALDAPFGRLLLKQALERIDPRGLDSLHRACHACLTARVGGAGWGMRLRVLRDALGAALTRLSDPYALFVWSLAAESCGWRPPWFLLAWWAPWNWATTPQAAAVLALQALAGSALRRGQQAQAWMLDQQLATGGFRAGPRAPRADLLSTAVALFALRLAGWRDEDRATRDLIAMVERCRTANGHWCDRPDGADGDAEYSFYALLALGAATW